MKTTEWMDAFVRLLSLALRLEGEGQYNLAKISRAQADSISRRAAWELNLSSDKETLQNEIKRLAASLDDTNLQIAFRKGVSALVSGRLPLFNEIPHPYVCRTCGHITLTPPAEPCPVCGAWAETFQKFMPNYWFDALEPPAALERLRATPLAVEKLIEGLSDEEINRTPADGGWAIRNTLSHLRDAQGVFDFRVDLFLKEAHPILESKAVFAWAKIETERPPSARDIFESYRTSRAETLRKLESLPLSDWWRTGEHEEFGMVTLRQQVSYFAAHESTHLSQIKALTR